MLVTGRPVTGRDDSKGHYRDMPSRSRQMMTVLAGALAGAVLLAGCQDSNVPKQMRPVPHVLTEKMKQSSMSETAPIFIRIFKESSELEVWKKRRDGKYALLKTYEICKWSGELGPKIKEGDRQAPEGFYTVTPAQMNPNSSYYLSFNIGYPNNFDRALGRTGSHLMVHGACSSAGCYSMTDESAGELFALARDAFRGGQRSFQIQAFPFRMTAENMAKHRDSPHLAFWRMLKEGSDHFEVTRVPPAVDVCDRRYVFNADAGGRSFNAGGACPAYTVPASIQAAVAAKQASDETKFAAAVTRQTNEVAVAEAQKRAAEEKQVAAAAREAEKQAAREARAAERAANPNLLTRMLGLMKRTPAEEAPAADSAAAAVNEAASTPAPAPSAPAATAPAASSASSAPTPPKKPANASPTASATPAPPIPPATATPAPQPTITPTMTPDIPSVGRFVKRDFNWPES